MKILYFTDTHDMGRNPGARIDDYHLAILKKFEEVVNAAIKNKVHAVVHGGDWWHYPKVANSIYNQHQRMLRRLRKNKIKTFAVPGNHDLYGYSLATLDQTSLGSLKDAGLVTLLTRGKSYTLDDGKVTIEIHGREYDAHIDKDPVNDYQIQENFMADLNILFAHGMLLDKAFHPDVRYTLTKDVVTDADHVFTGHYHDGYPEHTIGNTTFYNIGSTGRDEGSINNMTRTPQYAILEYTQGKFSVQLCPYQTAQQGKDIFDRTQLVTQKQHTRYLEAFEQTIVDAIAFDSFDPKDILQKATGIDQAIIDEAMALIVGQEQRVHDSKLDGYIVKKRPISISEIELINFQSHKKTTVVLNEKGLNALTGMSDSGKSAIIRCLRWVLYNEPKGSDFIRHGATRTTGTVRFSDGSSITRSRTKSSAGEYIITDHNGKTTEFKGFGNNLPIDIANIHQMPKVELTKGIERSLNFSFQLDGHFLLSESPAVRAATIGRLTGVHLVDDAIKEVDKEIRQITVDTNTSEKRIAELDESLKQYDTLAEEERKIAAVRTFYAAATKLEQTIEELLDLEDDYKEHTNVIKKIQHELIQYKNIDTITIQLHQAEDVYREIEVLTQLSEESEKAVVQIEKYMNALKPYKMVDKGVEMVEKAEALTNNVKELQALQSDYQNATTECMELEHRLEVYKGVSGYDNLDDLDRKESEIRDLRSLYKNYTTANETCDELQAQAEEQQFATSRIQDKVEKLIQEMGNKCPTCQQTLDEHSVEGMLEHV